MTPKDAPVIVEQIPGEPAPDPAEERRRLIAAGQLEMFADPPLVADPRLAELGQRKGWTPA